MKESELLDRIKRSKVDRLIWSDRTARLFLALIKGKPGREVKTLLKRVNLGE